MIAIKNLHGLEECGCKISVQLAAYGRAHSQKKRTRWKVVQKHGLKANYSIRDERMFREVLMGKKENNNVYRKCYGETWAMP